MRWFYFSDIFYLFCGAITFLHFTWIPFGTIWLLSPESTLVAPVSGATSSFSTRSTSRDGKLQKNLPSSSRSFHQRSSLCYRDGSGGPWPSDQFYELPSTVTPTRYKLRFRIDPERKRLYGHALIGVYLHNQTTTIELNAVKLTINGASFRTRNVRVDSRMVYYCPEKETIVLQFPKPLHRGGANLTINFFGNLTDMMLRDGFVKTFGHSGKTEQWLTDFGPLDARRKFPCWDEPRFKTPFDLYLIVPKNALAVSNAAPNRRRAYSTEFEDVRFATTPPMAPFQLATIFGHRFHVYQNNHTAYTDPNNNVSIRLFTTSRTNGDGLEQWQYALETGQMFMQYFTYYFNHRYPLDKIDLIALANYEQTSVEKFGLIFFDQHQLKVQNRSTATDQELFAVAETLAHAFAHQWLGNMVTFERWSQFWLYEALTSYMEKEALDGLFPQWKSWQQYTANEMGLALEADSSSQSMPIVEQIRHPNDIAQAYPNVNGYRKATLLLRMLRSAIGEETYQKAIQTFVKTYANKTATDDDLWLSFAKVVGLPRKKSRKNSKMDIQDYKRQVVNSIANWTRMAGFPVLHVEEKQEGETRILTIRQERFFEYRQNNASKTNDSDIRHINDQALWPIPISVINSFNPFTPTHHTLMTTKELVLSVEEIWEGEWVKLNPDFANFYRVHYSESMLEKFTISIEEKLLPPLDRLNLVDDLFALIRAGTVATDVGLRFLWSYENEDNPNVWQVIVSALNDIDALVSSVNDQNLLNKYRHFGRELLAKQYHKLGWYSDTSLPPVGHKMKVEHFAKQQLRKHVLCRIGQFRYEAFVQEASKKFVDYLNGMSDLPVDLLECVFRSYSLFNVTSDKNYTFNHLFNYYKEYDMPEARHLFSIALASTENETQIDKVINFSLQPVVQTQDTHTMLKELSEQSQLGRTKVLTMIGQNFYKLANKFPTISAMYEFVKDIVETFAQQNTVELKLEKLLKKDPKLTMLHQMLRTSLERVEIFQKWIERDRTVLEQFFNPRSNLATENDGDYRHNTLGGEESAELIDDIGDNNFFNFEEFDKK